MAELLKNKLNAQSLMELARCIQAADPAFLPEAFVREVMDETWPSLELKARIRHAALILGRWLPADYRQAAAILLQALRKRPAQTDSLTWMCLPDFVEVFGQNEADWAVSMNALEQMTPVATAEFAVRPFIIRDQKRMMAQMESWAHHPNEHVRRLASEGCRPQLPWGQALVCFKQDPRPVLRVLDLLKADRSPYVAKSVANNLNDISKTHPQLVLQKVREEIGRDSVTDWILKHGCRTLLKKGDPEALALFGLADQDGVEITEFQLETPEVPIGGELVFSFVISAKKNAKVRLEYQIDYVKASGKRSPKIFKISESACEAQTRRKRIKRHSFADCSVRKHYPGRHSITLRVNGQPQGTRDFEVRPADQKD